MDQSVIAPQVAVSSPLSRIAGRRVAAGFVLTCAAAAAVLGLLVGSSVLMHPGRAVVGWNPASDFQIMTWSLTWWPWAAMHGISLTSHLLWAPHGFSTLWMTSMPAVALVGLPLTLTAGPVVAYNTLMFAAVGLAGGCAFLLCREVTGRTVPSLVGGIVFATSPYMLGHTLSQHLNLTFAWPIPLVAWAIVHRSKGGWRRHRSFVMVTASLLLVELGSSLELFVDLTVVLCLWFVLSLAVPGVRRGDILRIGSGVACAYCVCLPVLVAILYLALEAPHGALRYWAGDYSTDLANVVIPTPLSLLGTPHTLHHLSRHFVGNIGEQDGYLGLPLLAAAALGARARWRQGGAGAAALLAVVLALSLGPAPALDGRQLLRLPLGPWRLPVVADVLPGRLAVFTMLVAVCLAAVWLSLPHPLPVRAAAATAILLSLLPNVSLPHRLPGAWSVSDITRFSTPTPPRGFTAAAGWRRVIRRGETVLVLPAGDRTDALYWQVRSGMRFRLAIPATPFVPPMLDTTPTVVGLTNDSLVEVDGPPLAAARLRSYLAAERIGAVAITRRGLRTWRAVVAAATATSPRALGGVLVYTVRRRQTPLHAAGERIVARAGTVELKTWLRFDGRHAQVIASGQGRRSALSSSSSDAETLAAALNRSGRAAIVFGEVRAGRLLLRAATTARKGSWDIVTLDLRSRPVWSPRVAVAARGSIVAAWFAAASPVPLVRVAIRPRSGPWRTLTLDSAEGVSGLEVASLPPNAVRVTWHDTVGTEQRVLATTCAATGCSHPAVIGGST